MSVQARAKLNLTLDVLGRRPDGYHELCMVMQSVQLCDVLEIAPGEGRVSSNLGYLPTGEGPGIVPVKAAYAGPHINADNIAPF